MLRLAEAWLEAQVAFERLPSLSVAVVLDGQLAWRRAWGQADHAGRVPASPDTAYSICSISKLFTTVAALRLWEDGRLTLDDDIGKLLPAFAVQRSDPESGPITVRTLLTHASGLPREADFAYWTPPDFRFPTRAELLQDLARQRTERRTNQRHAYSNLGMAVLGEVITAAAGQPYAEFVQTHVLEPLKLSNTRPDMPAALWGTGLAQGFGALRRDGTRDPLPLFDARALAPAAGFSSTAEDLARFATWALRLRNHGGHDTLRAATVREMLRVQWTDPDAAATWGLGFAVLREGNTALASHSGLCPGYLSHLVLGLDDDMAVVAMSNANDNRGMSRLTQPLRRLLMKGRRLPVAAPAGPPLADYAGRYSTQPLESEHVVLPWGKDLAALWLPVAEPATALLVLRHVAGDTFRTVRADGSLAESFTFQRDTSGRVVNYRRWNQTWGRVDR